MTKTGNTEGVKSMEFVEVVSDKKLRDHNIHRADVLMVVGFKDGHAMHDDPYLFRKYAVVIKVVDNIIQVPDQHKDYMSYVIDPRSVKSVGPVRQKYYEGLLNEQYGQ